MKLVCGHCQGKVFDVKSFDGVSDYGDGGGMIGSCPTHGRVDVRILDSTPEEIAGMIIQPSTTVAAALKKEGIEPPTDGRCDGIPAGNNLSKRKAFSEKRRTIQGRSTCPECKKEFDLEAVEVSASMANAMASMMKAIHCEECSDRRLKKERNERDSKTMANLIEAGLIRSDLTRFSLATSDQAVETKNPELWSWVRKYDPPGLREDGRPMNLFVWGPPGVGKTFAIRCVLNRLVESNHRVMEKSASQVLDAMGSKRTRADFLMLCGNVWAAYFSDCHIPVWNAQSMTDFWHVIDIRHSNGLPTFLDANMDLAALDRVFTKARPGNAATAASLWERMRPASVFEVEGESLRSKG